MREPAAAAQRRLRRVPPRPGADRARRTCSRSRAGSPPEVAAMVEPLACCLHGVERAGVAARADGRGDRAGPIGLMLCACVADAGGAPGRRRRPARSGAHSRRDFGAEPGDGEGADVVIEAAGTARRLARRARARAARRHGARLRRAAARRTRRARPVPHPLRGGDAARRLPPHAAARAGGARVPRERRVSVRAAGHAPGRARGRAGAASPTRREDYLKAVVQAAKSVSSGSRSPRSSGEVDLDAADAARLGERRPPAA